MSDLFYSDRLNGPRPQDREELAPATVRGLIHLFKTRMDANWLADAFPEHCWDGNGVVGTDIDGLKANLQALVPEAPWPLTGAEEHISDEVLFDLVEYMYRRIAQPRKMAWHSFFHHHELDFDQQAGRETFRSEVNSMLRRGGAMYELSSDGEIGRLGTTVVQHVIASLVPASGDVELDALISEATEKYASRRESDRSVAVERLWDAFERLKTIDVPGSGNKKASIAVLLDNIKVVPWRDVVEAEMDSLTRIGNDFNIRHFESRVTILPPEAGDYLFGRMGSLLLHLLAASNRIADGGQAFRPL